MSIEIRELNNNPHTIESLSSLLIEAVAEGASMSFIHPLAPAKASAFWHESLAEAERGNYIILGAFDGARFVGTVTLHLVMKENQPHRAEIAKMAVARAYRKQGIGRKLLYAAERKAMSLDRKLLVLDTETDSDAARFYEATGWIKAGSIPDFAFTADGSRFCPASLYWKKLGPLTS